MDCGACQPSHHKAKASDHSHISLAVSSTVVARRALPVVCPRGPRLYSSAPPPWPLPDYSHRTQPGSIHRPLLDHLLCLATTSLRHTSARSISACASLEFLLNRSSICDPSFSDDLLYLGSERGEAIGLS